MGSAGSTMSALRLAVLSRQANARDELETEFIPLRNEFTTLQIVKYDFTQIHSVGANAQLAVVDLKVWQPSDEMMLTQLRQHGFRGATVVLTTRLSESASASYAADQLLFFDPRRKSTELLGLVRRLLLGSVIASRKHPRHPTDEDAELQIDGGSTTHKCKIRNLSSGGALIEVDRDLRLRTGDTIALKIQLSSVGRVHAVKARIAWVNGMTFGAEFLNR